jgi:hypothetical protein
MSRYWHWLALIAVLAGMAAIVGAMPTAAEPMADTRLQLAHLAPFAMDPGTAVTVTLNGTPYPNIEFADSTGYLPALTGDNTVQIFPAGSATPVISLTVPLADATDYTAIAVGGANMWPLDLKLLVDDNTAPTSGSAKVRIGHLAPFAPGPPNTLADVRLQDGTILPGFNDVPYDTIANYIELPAGTYDLKITSADGSVTLIDPLPVTLADGDIVSVFAVGDGGNQPVGVFALPSGAPGSLLPLAAGLQLAHLAPFAMDPGTAVTVTLNGMPYPGIEFADSTGYLPVPAGMNMVQIFPGSSPTPAISATVYLTHATDFTAVAVGGANMWPIDLKLLVDDNTAPTSGSAKVRIGHLAPFAAGSANTLADVRLQDGTLLPGFDDVPYDTIANYIELPAGTYDLKITSADGNTTLIDPFPFAVNDGDIVSVFAVGDGANQPLGVFALPSGAPGSLLPLTSRLQLAHLAPFAMDPGTAVTVTLNGVDILTGVEFADSTGYLPVPSGNNQVQIFPGSSTTPAISATVFITADMDFTAIAVGGANMWPLDLKLLVDDNTAPTPGFVKVRVGHLAPFAAGSANTLADVRLQNGIVLPGFNDVPYDTISDYVELPAGTYDLKITSPDGSVTLIDPMPVTLTDGDIASVFAVGDGANQPLGVFALPSGAPGALLPLTPRLQLAHLAPFAMDPGTAVTVTLNGVDVLTGVEFADSTGYLWVPAGDNMVQVFPGSSATPAISATVFLTESTDFTAIAVGGPNMWPIGLKLLVDDAAPSSGVAKVRIGHLAPFAAGSANTLADVRLQDGTILPGFDDVPYDTIADHIALPAGTYDLKITSADGSATLIDPLPVALGSGDVLSVFAVGDGVNQSLGVFALPSGAPGSLLPLKGQVLYMPLIYKDVQ